MYLQYAFLLTDFYHNEYIPDSLESSSIVVPVNRLLWKERAYYFQKLYATSATFCFGFFQSDLERESTEMNPIRDSLSSYFFLPNYAKKGGAYLLVFDFDNGTSKEAMDNIEQVLETQGITPLSKNYTVENGGISRSNKHYYYSNDLIVAFKESASIDFAALFQKIRAANGLNKQIILPVTDEEDFKQKIGIIKDFEQWISNHEKEYADLLFVYKKTNDEYLKLKIENDKLRFRLDNYGDYLKALRKLASKYVDEYHRHSREQQYMGQPGTDAPPAFQQAPPPMAYNTSDINQELNFLRTNREEILQWYMKEYEALPLWYKRFGHVIKVATGKKKIKEYLHRQKKS